MRKFFELPTLFIITLALTTTMATAKDYIIYSIAQDFPMGNPNEVLKKNFYVDMGKTQGVKKGSILDVYRIVSVLDPYESKKRYNHRVKVGEVKILHSEDTSAIGVLNQVDKDEDEETPALEIGKMMIGDVVAVKVK